jgi:hypothetical protein
LISLVIFWALFPPMWFFTEYFAFDCGYIELPSHSNPAKISETKEFLGGLKEYAGFAAPVWAGFGAIFAGLLTQLKEPTAREGDGTDQ